MAFTATPLTGQGWAERGREGEGEGEGERGKEEGTVGIRELTYT